jgi:hypothetical protein
MLEGGALQPVDVTNCPLMELLGCAPQPSTMLSVMANLLRQLATEKSAAAASMGPAQLTLYVTITSSSGHAGQLPTHSYIIRPHS